MNTLVLGLGNPILTDDSIGHWVAKEIRGRVNHPGITVAETSLSGLSLLDLLAGYDRAIIIDAIQTVGGKAGQIYRIEPEAFTATRNAGSPHDVDFTTALKLGSQLKLDMPSKIDIFGIEVVDTCTFSEECTPEVKEAIPACVEMIMQELKEDYGA